MPVKLRDGMNPEGLFLVGPSGKLPIVEVVGQDVIVLTQDPAREIPIRVRFGPEMRKAFKLDIKFVH